MDDSAMPETMPEEHPFKALEPIKETPVSPAVGIAALALNMSLKFHDINTVQDGTLYQQYKIEGKNMGALHLDHVFDTAVRMEAFLLGASERIASLVFDAIAMPEEDTEAGDDDPAATITEDDGSGDPIMPPVSKGDSKSG